MHSADKPWHGSEIPLNYLRLYFVWAFTRMELNDGTTVVLLGVHPMDIDPSVLYLQAQGPSGALYGC